MVRKVKLVQLYGKIRQNCFTLWIISPQFTNCLACWKQRMYLKGINYCGFINCGINVCGSVHQKCRNLQNLSLQLRVFGICSKDVEQSKSCKKQLWMLITFILFRRTFPNFLISELNRGYQPLNFNFWDILVKTKTSHQKSRNK